MSEAKLKATDYVTESLKLVVGISMPLVGGLVAYGINAGTGSYGLSFYLSTIFLLGSSILAIININSLINKIHDGRLDAIKDTPVRVINALTLGAFLVGVGCGLLYVWNNPMSTSATHQNSDVILIENNKIQFPKNTTAKVKIEKDSSGNIEKILVNQ